MARGPVPGRPGPSIIGGGGTSTGPKLRARKHDGNSSKKHSCSARVLPGRKIKLPGRILAELLPEKYRNQPCGWPKAGPRAEFDPFPAAVRPESPISGPKALFRNLRYPSYCKCILQVGRSRGSKNQEPAISHQCQIPGGLPLTRLKRLPALHSPGPGQGIIK